MKTKAESIKWETNTIKNKKPRLGSLKTNRLSSETKNKEKAEISRMRKKIIIKPRNSKKVIIKHLKDLHQKLENTDFGKPKLTQGKKKNWIVLYLFRKSNIKLTIPQNHHRWFQWFFLNDWRKNINLI